MHTQNIHQANLAQSTPTSVQQNRSEAPADFALARDASMDTALLSMPQFFVPTPFLKVTLKFTDIINMSVYRKKILVSIFCAAFPLIATFGKTANPCLFERRDTAVWEATVPIADRHAVKKLPYHSLHPCWSRLVS